MLRRVFFLLLIAAAPASAQTEAGPAELERINAAIERVAAELAESRNERGTVATDIEAAEKSILDNRHQIDAVRLELEEQQEELQELRARQQLLEADSAAQRELIATYARSAWMSGNEEYLKLVLNQEDPRQSARMLRYYGYLSEARAEKLAAFKQTLDDMTRVAADIEAGTLALEQQQQTLTARQESLAAGQQQRQQLMANLDADLAAQGAQLDQLELDKVEIELLLQELQSSVAELSLDEEQEPFAERKGLLPWPLDGPHINSFGERHTLGDLTREGVTIGASAGDKVRAIHHGRVVFADWFTTSGLLLIIDHGGGYMSLYAHNQELYKAVGEWVAAGDVIAAAGNTGGQREASLYFEIRRDGRAENPLNWCTPR
jgi:septal ring factor EnvC (AmiA/AmiB activator)